jgi:hypothetical protein
MARYIEVEKELAKIENRYESSSQRHNYERKYNRCKPHELFEYLLSYINLPRPFKPFKHNPIDYLYQSANKTSWNELESFISTPKWLPSQKTKIINLVKNILKKSPPTNFLARYTYSITILRNL